MGLNWRLMVEDLIQKIAKLRQYHFNGVKKFFFGGNCLNVYQGLIYFLDLYLFFDLPGLLQNTKIGPKCRPQLAAQFHLMSPYCSTLLIHSTCLERQRTQAVDSLDLDVPHILVCRGFPQK